MGCLTYKILFALLVTLTPAIVHADMAPESANVEGLFVEGQDTLISLMNAVLEHDSSNWTEKDWEDNLIPKHFGAEPTFVPKSRDLYRNFLSDNPREVLPVQIEELKRINAYYNDQYQHSSSMGRFPCWTLTKKVYRRSSVGLRVSRVDKFAILEGTELSAFICRDRESGQEFRFMFTVDPGVIEVFIQSDTIENMAAKEPLIQAVLFNVMNHLGFEPDPYRGMGHLHMSYGLFDGTAHIQKFVHHLLNHSELFDGIWENDHFNAKPLRKLLESKPLPPTILRALYQQMPEKISLIALHWLHTLVFNGEALGVDLAPEHQTVEIRGNHAFENAHLMVAQMKILNRAITTSREMSETDFYIDHPKKVPEQMLHDYFDFVGDSVDRETARRLILPGFRPNLRHLSLDLYPCESALTGELR